MFDSFYIHDVQIERTTKTVDTTKYPPVTTTNVSLMSLQAFMDTPATSEAVQYHQRNIKLTRFLYYAYGAADIRKMDIILFEGNRYEVTGTPENQGGQNEVMRLPLNML